MDKIQAAIHAIESGLLVIVPTRRWYMLCCDAGNPAACDAIFSAKRRPLTKSLLLVLRSNEEASRWFQIGPDAATLIRHFWPGDLALRLRWSETEFSNRCSAVGVPVALVSQPSGVLGDLARQSSVSIAATSANISGSPESQGVGPAISPEEVATFLQESGAKVAVVIEDGICPEFMPMTIVDCSSPNSRARIVREGSIHPRSIAAALLTAGREHERLRFEGTPFAKSDR
jgi:L-threonylcarbamoyladenylate synthase